MILVLVFIPAITFSRSIISGQVVDAETGKAIKNAAVYIFWGKAGGGPPGLSGDVKVEVAENLSNSEGFFNIPKYSTLFKYYTMTVYKKGYVCWNSEKIYPTREERNGFKLKNKMVIKLEKFKEEYSIEDHARFTNSMAIWSSGVFYKATEAERKIEHIYDQKDIKALEEKK